MKRSKRKKLPVNLIIKKLGQFRERKGNKKNEGWVFGLYYRDAEGSIPANTILIEPRQSARSFMNTLIHEMLHRMVPGWKETPIKKTANEITAVLWDQGYRKDF